MIAPDRVAGLLGEGTLINPTRRTWRENDDDLTTGLVKQQDQFTEMLNGRRCATNEVEHWSGLRVAHGSTPARDANARKPGVTLRRSLASRMPSNALAELFLVTVC